MHLAFFFFRKKISVEVLEKFFFFPLWNHNVFFLWSGTVEKIVTKKRMKENPTFFLTASHLVLHFSCVVVHSFHVRIWVQLRNARQIRGKKDLANKRKLFVKKRNWHPCPFNPVDRSSSHCPYPPPPPFPSSQRD